MGLKRIKNFIRIKIRPIKYWWQRRTRGWDDSELWSLDITFAEWFLPRIEKLAEIRKNWFVLEPEEIAEFQEMIDGFKSFLDDELNCARTNDEEEAKKLARALELFAKNFRRMWW